MANIEYHGLLKSIDENDNIKVLYPKTYVSDIIMSGGGALEDVLNNKQNKTDNKLATTSKTVVEAINELNTNLNKIGLSYYKSGSKSIASSSGGEYTTIASQTAIPAGMYILIGQISFELTSNTGSRVANLTDGNGNALAADVEVQGNANGYTQLSINTILHAAENQTVKLNARQNSGNSITTSGVIRMIRIK